MWQFLLLIPLLAIIFILWELLFKLYVAARRYKQMDSSLPVFVSSMLRGALFLQKQNILRYGDSHQHVKQLVQDNPDVKAFLVTMGNYPSFQLVDTNLIKEFCQNPKNYRKLNRFKHNTKCFTQSLLFSEDDIWSNQRKIIQHSFNHEQLKAILPKIQLVISSHATDLKGKIKINQNEPIHYAAISEIERVIGEIVVRVLFSDKAFVQKVGDLTLAEALADFNNSVVRTMRKLPTVLLSLFIGRAIYDINIDQDDRKFQAQLNQIRRITVAILEQRMALKQDPQHDFIYHYIQEKKRVDAAISEAEKKGQKHQLRQITLQEIVHQLIIFYFAGIDTTSRLITFSLYAIAEYPQCRDLLMQEMQEKIGDSPIGYEQMQKLTYMDIFIKETLRMWPPVVSTLTRHVLPYHITEDTLVGVSLLALMHNPKYFENPQIFDPTRWTRKEGYSDEAFSYIPFSAGPRSCIGKFLALTEAKLMIATFLREFQLKRTEKPLRLHVKTSYTPIDDDFFTIGLK